LWFGYGWGTKRSCFALERTARPPLARNLDDARVAVQVGVVDVEEVVAPVGGVEGDRKQAALAAALDPAADVEERRRAQLSAGEHPDRAGLLHDVDVARLAGRGRDVGRRGETLRDGLEVDRGGKRGRDDERQHQLVAATGAQT
jgi:hypothetical protein